MDFDDETSANRMEQRRVHLHIWNGKDLYTIPSSYSVS